MRILTTIALLMMLTHGAGAQERWSVEGRLGFASPTGDLGSAGLSTGFGFEGTIAYRFLPHLAAYAGWGWQQFGTDGVFAGAADLDVEETGYTFGLRFIHPFASLASYMIEAGGIYNHIELEAGDDLRADTGHGLGWQLGAGVVLALGEQWYLAPAVRYRSLSRDVTLGGVSAEADLRYISATVGISRTF